MLQSESERLDIHVLSSLQILYYYFKVNTDNFITQIQMRQLI